MEAELKSHEQFIEAVCASGQDLIASGHYASESIREMKNSLHKVWSNLQEATSKRSEVLQGSMNAQQYYVKASEAESWMNDRDSLVSHGEYGKDEDSTQVCSPHTQRCPHFRRCTVYRGVLIWGS